MPEISPELQQAVTRFLRIHGLNEANMHQTEVTRDALGTHVHLKWNPETVARVSWSSLQDDFEVSVWWTQEEPLTLRQHTWTGHHRRDHDFAEHMQEYLGRGSADNVVNAILMQQCPSCRLVYTIANVERFPQIPPAAPLTIEPYIGWNTHFVQQPIKLCFECREPVEWAD